MKENFLRMSKQNINTWQRNAYGNTNITISDNESSNCHNVKASVIVTHEKKRLIEQFETNTYSKTFCRRHLTKMDSCLKQTYRYIYDTSV